MQVKMYKAFLIQPEGKKYQVIKPAIFMSISQMIDIIEKGQPYREMFFVYHEALGDLISPLLHDKYGSVHPEMFDVNPKVFGVLCYKDKNGRIRYK